MYNKYGYKKEEGIEIEEVETVVNPAYPDFPIAKFPPMERAPLGGSGRWYFKSNEYRFYSGITGPIHKSSFVDASGLDRARKKMAFEGRDADVEWRERADYGTCFHLLVSLHERNVVRFDFNDDGKDSWRNVMEDCINAGGYQMMREKWDRDLRNDFAAYFKWKREKNVVVITTELMVCWEEGKMATPLDIICEMDFNGGRIVADVNLKTGDVAFRQGYDLQTALEAWMYNNQIGDSKYRLQGAFCWRPKSRESSPGEYELSKNYIDMYGEKHFNHLADIVRLGNLNEPNGKVVIYSGTEETFNVNIYTPYEWLERRVEGKA